MPRNNQGIYSLPSGNPVVTGTTITSTWANSTMPDLANEISGSLPRNGSAPMTGPLLLNGNASLPLQAVPFQQFNNITAEAKIYRDQAENFSNLASVSETNSFDSSLDAANCKEVAYNSALSAEADAISTANDVITATAQADIAATNAIIATTQAGIATTQAESITTNSLVTLQTGTTGASILPVGTTAQRPASPVDGYIRYNTDLLTYEAWDSTKAAWGSVGGGGISKPEAIKTANFTAEVGKNYPINVSASPVIVTLPSSPKVGDWLQLFDYTGDCGVINSIYLTCTKPIHGKVEDVRVSASNISLVLQYVDATQGWKIVDGIGEGGGVAGGITTIWIGSAGNGITVDWSGTGKRLSDFDAILLVCIGTGVRSTLAVPASILINTITVNQAPTELLYISTNTETSARVTAVGGTVLTGIYGINYN